MQIRAFVDGVDAPDALRLVIDYRRWPAASEAVNSVEVHQTDDRVAVSDWEVTFRGGRMRWTERDVFDPDALEQRFTLIEGDPYDFAGVWSAIPRDGGCVLRLLGDFDLGMPSLRHVLDPIAIEALEDAITEVLCALFGDTVHVELAEPVA
jgi:ribosome-associated toxin RatA of RatAB toxin-antitoxin module